MRERQQVNLYQPAADEGRRPFSARAAGFALGAVSVTLLGIWAFGTWRVGRVQRAVDALQLQQHHQEDAVTAAGTMHAARANPEQLQTQIKELTTEVAIRRRALDLLRAGAEGRPVGFSARLAGLARRHIDGLWIEHLVLSGTTGTMTLEGVAMDADLVPRFLSDLGKDPALAGARFDALVIERPAHAAAQDEEPAQAHAAPPRNSMRFRAESNALLPAQPTGQAS